jgi:hypothetical protein
MQVRRCFVIASLLTGCSFNGSTLFALQNDDGGASPDAGFFDDGGAFPDAVLLDDGGTPWLTGFDQRIRLTIDSSKIDTNLSNFPVMVHLSTSTGITNSDVSAVFDELGADGNRKRIAVTKDDAMTEMFVEIEHWDHANEQALLWVKVSGSNAISSAGDTALYLYYDADHAENTDYVDDVNTGNSIRVWNEDEVTADYRAVWHLAETPDANPATSEMLDSTGNGNHGDTAGMAAGDQVDGALDFDGTDDIVTTTVIDIARSFTITALVFPRDTQGNGRRILEKHDGPDETYRLQIQGTQQLVGRVTNDVGARVSPASVDNVLPLNQWIHTALVYDGSTATIYANGVEVNSLPQTGDLQSGTSNIEIGGSTFEPRFWDGVIDEVRVSSTNRSAAWIRATYASVSDDLLTFDGQEVD